MLAIGLWMELQLHKYMELSTLFSTTIPLIFVGLGGTILGLSVLACCCTAKGKVLLLYIVSNLVPKKEHVEVYELPLILFEFFCEC